MAQTASMAFPRNEPFTGNAATNFTFGGTARLTGVGGTDNDPVGSGYLRLTNATTNQAGYVIDNVGFPSSEGFSISFEFFSYGGSGADGFSVFLVDADNQPADGFRIGATGGSLGYAQKDISPIAPGVSGGYIGIGIDEFGNYSNRSEGRSGGSNFLTNENKVPHGVAIRGAGNGSANTDYPYLVGTKPGDMGFTLDVPTVRAQSGSADYRRAYIDVVPTTSGSTTTYLISVRIQHGLEVRTTVENFTVPKPPANLRLGFSGSTGTYTNVHEIRNLNIVQVPFATDDVASTNYNQATDVRILNNDVAPGSNIDPRSVDLDPSVTGQQTELRVEGKGTFRVNQSGVVTFEPSGTFAGTVVIPYTMQSILGAAYSSSPANITVNVAGADVAATLTGPATATAGEEVTYTIKGANRSGLTATDVVLSMRLPANLPAGAVAPQAGGTYYPTTGLVTFDKVSSLSSGAPAIERRVTVTLPNSQTETIANKAEAWSAVPDPVTSNNVATLNTGISAPLPVELLNFVAKPVGSDAYLTWETSSELNSRHFEVERSQDGRTFKRIATVASKGTTQQHSAYAHTDARAASISSQPIYYRLRQVDLNGKAKYSQVQTVQFGQEHQAIMVYPNPANIAATLDLTALPVGTYSLTIYDVVGRLILQTQVAGGELNPLGVEKMPKGMYLLRVKGHGFFRNLPLVRE